MQIPTRRALQGAAVAIGAPVGWLGLRVANGAGLWGELSGHAGLYLYLLFPTLVAFASFGVVLGRHEVRLATVVSELRDTSLTDELTGLKNRRYFRARLEEELAVSLRTSAPLAVAVMDLDRFKTVNDTFGHPEGDRVLKAVASAILSVVRRGESAARVGGEEFALLLPGADGGQAVAASERMRSAVARIRLHPNEGGNPIRVAASVGCASTEDVGLVEADELYSAADAALYSAKRAGRDRTVRAGYLVRLPELEV